MRSLICSCDSVTALGFGRGSLSLSFLNLGVSKGFSAMSPSVYPKANSRRTTTRSRFTVEDLAPPSTRARMNFFMSW